jgi:hypothetical protein
LCQQNRDWLRNFVDHDAGWPNRDPRVQLRCQKVWTRERRKHWNGEEILVRYDITLTKNLPPWLR